MICSSFIMTQNSFGQFNFSHLDSLRNNFPPDSTYSPNRMIVKFKPTTLDLDQLCFTYETVSENSKPTERTLMSDAQYYNLRTYLANQRFYVKDLLTDTLLANFLVAIGADTLSRLTFASPCVDTLSITRHGDTIPIQDHLYMVLHFKNDTSIVMATYVLNGFYNSYLYRALPDFKYNMRITPNDTYYGYQKSLKSAYTNVENAWNFERGSSETKIAIIDDGIDYKHCEFNQLNLGTGNKVVFGWSYVTNDNAIEVDSEHGTKIAGIIGAPTNRASLCPAAPSGIAGINGGWGGPNNSGSIGASLIGYKCQVFGNNSFLLSHLISAIKDAVSNSPDSKYGQGIHFINASWGFGYDVNNRFSRLDLEQAISSAYEHKVVFVAAKDNAYTQEVDLPSGGEINKVFAVSSSDEIDGNDNHYLYSQAGHGNHLDILAPSTDCPIDLMNNIVYTTIMRNPTDSEWQCPGAGTSFATPQVVGIASLLHSYKLTNYTTWDPLHPEDYEGILKVSAKDINHIYPYENNFDQYSGWGVVDAYNVFKKIDIDKFSLIKYSTENVTEFGDWSDQFMIYFENSNEEKYIETDWYFVRRRKVTYTVTHPTTWKVGLDNNVDYKIYVWGTGGNDHSLNGKKGLNFTENRGVNFQTGYTGVISGYGGNEENETNMIHDNSIPSGNAHEFTFVNYQYEVTLKDNSGTIKIPEDTKLAAHYSVFGVDVTTSVQDDIEVSNFETFPTIVSNNIQIKLNAQSSSKIVVLNSFGSVMFTKEVKSGISSIDVSHLPIGSYFVTNGVQRKHVQKFIILR
jgi:hypothetical protein